jgi:hypothetical protein
MRDAQNFYYFGVPEYVVMIEILYPKGTSYGRTTTQMKSFHDAIKIVSCQYHALLPVENLPKDADDKEAPSQDTIPLAATLWHA